MIRSFRAELVRLTRRRILLTTVLAGLVFAVGGTLIALGAAKPIKDDGAKGLLPSVEALQAAGGGTEVFRGSAAFAGTFVFVVIVGLFAAEYSRGTVRTMLLRQPRRLQLLAGRILATLVFAAVTLFAVEVLMWVLARVFASGFGISAGAWTSFSSIGDGLADFGSVLMWVTGYTVFGATVAVLLRSVPIALAVGLAWAGPIEHLVGDSWSPGQHYFPGLLLETLASGGSAQVSEARALLTIAVYVVIATAITGIVFRRRDITA